MKSIVLISILTLSTAIFAVPSYTQEDKKNKIEVVNTAGEMYWKWHDAVERQCEKETAILVVAMFEAKQAEGYIMTENDVNKLKSTLMFSCSKFYNIAI